MQAVVLGFADYAPQARRLAACLGLSYGEIAVHRFPDGESKVTVPTRLPADVIVCRSLDRPNDKLIELLLASSVIRQQGVQRISLVAPYLCYMRQDKAFHPGEAVSQTVIGQYLADICDNLVSVDPHLHRTLCLQTAVPGANAVALTAAPALGDYLRQRWQQPLLIGPDAESEQWVKAVAEHHRLDYGIAAKRRLGDREVAISLPELSVTGRDLVLIDDVASTAQTLITVAKALRERKPKSVSAVVTHALFSEQALALLRDSGVASVTSTDSVPHPSNAIELAPLLADALRPLIDKP